MTRSLLLLGFGIFVVVMGLFCWALCYIAASSDARINQSDCFSRYQLHIDDCPTCRPPDVLCAIGVALRHEAIETLTDKQLEARVP